MNDFKKKFCLRSYSGILAGGGASRMPNWALGVWFTCFDWKSFSMRQSISNNSWFFFWTTALGFSFAISSFNWDGAIPEKLGRFLVGIGEGKLVKSHSTDDEDNLLLAGLYKIFRTCSRSLRILCSCKTDF